MSILKKKPKIVGNKKQILPGPNTSIINLNQKSNLKTLLC